MKAGPALVMLVAVLSAACSQPAPNPPPGQEDAKQASGSTSPEKWFVDVTETAGIDFVHANGGTGKKYLPEIMGAGGAVLDFDSDGFMDVFLVQSGSFPGTSQEPATEGDRLYRNQGDGTFRDVTRQSGIPPGGYGMGAVAGDYDSDGDPDLYRVAYGPDTLYRNNGDGTFSDVTAQAGLGSSLWGSSATFFDAENDGDIDLYVVNYLDFSISKHIDCGQPSQGILSYCSPDVYQAAPDILYENQGDGTFTDATDRAGIEDRNGKGLGVITADFNQDGLQEIYVANDSTPNFLFENLGQGRFIEAGLFWGVSHNEDGLTEAGMGTDSGDVDGDGRLDIIVTNLSNETNALYLGDDGEFRYHTRTAGLYSGSLRPVGFGVDLVDLENDQDLDILVANGHVIDNIDRIGDGQSFPQPAQVFLNDGQGNFQELSAAEVGDPAIPRVGRATLTLDYDNDGRREVLIIFNNDRARLFRNQSAAGNWIGFHLRGLGRNRNALGARVWVKGGEREQMEESKTASSYLSSGDPRLHFGLGVHSTADQVRIRWPSGQTQVFHDVEGNHYYLLEEGSQLRRPAGTQ